MSPRLACLAADLTSDRSDLQLFKRIACCMKATVPVGECTNSDALALTGTDRRESRDTKMVHLWSPVYPYFVPSVLTEYQNNGRLREHSRLAVTGWQHIHVLNNLSKRRQYFRDCS